MANAGELEGNRTLGKLAVYRDRCVEKFDDLFAGRSAACRYSAPMTRPQSRSAQE